MAKISECKEMMAYAVGRVTCIQDGDHKSIALKLVNPEWDKYELSAHGHGKTNDSYALYYSGPFGKEKAYVKILGIPEGWSLKHMTAMLIAAIEMHEAEIEE